MGIVLTILAVLALIVVLGFILPDRQQVSRTTRIAAPPEAVYPHIADFQNWQSWSPWAGRDPNMKMEITGDGVGQTMAWTSDAKNVGSGRQEILRAEAPTLLETALDFGDMGKAVARFDLAPAEGGATDVTWHLDTKMRNGVPLPMRPVATYMGFFMDKMVGKDYEQGLAALKDVIENAHAQT